MWFRKTLLVEERTLLVEGPVEVRTISVRAQRHI